MKLEIIDLDRYNGEFLIVYDGEVIAELNIKPKDYTIDSTTNRLKIIKSAMGLTNENY